MVIGEEETIISKGQCNDCGSNDVKYNFKYPLGICMDCASVDIVLGD